MINMRVFCRVATAATKVRRKREEGNTMAWDVLKGSDLSIRNVLTWGQATKRGAAGAVLIASLAVAACQPNAQQAVLARAVIASDDPQATDLGRQVLQGGGNAVDAAVTMAMAMAVTLPSRVGVGGGGTCLVHDPVSGDVTSYDFPSDETASGQAGLPTMVRGIFAMHTEAGASPWPALISPAERMAMDGFAVSVGLASDIASISNVLDQLPQLARLFTSPSGLPLTPGAPMRLPGLAPIMTEIRLGGVPELYNGETGRRFAEGAVQSGVRIDVEEIRAIAPSISPANYLEVGNDRLWYQAEPLTGGPALADAAQRLMDWDEQDYEDAEPLERLSILYQVQRPALRTVATGGEVVPGASLVVADRDGRAVACTLTLNGVFGSGSVAGDTDIIIAAAPARGVMRSSGLSIVSNHFTRTFLYAGAGTEMFSASLFPLAERIFADVGLDTAVRSARLATDFSQGGILVESRTPDVVLDVASGLDNPVRRAPWLGVAQAIGCDWDRETRVTQCLAVSDPRGFGEAVTDEAAGLEGGLVFGR